jgi:hypothetical protein
MVYINYVHGFNSIHTAFGSWLVRHHWLRAVAWTGHWWLRPVILATWEDDIQRIEDQGQPQTNNSRLSVPKITRAKWTGSVVQAVEYFLCKCKALSSNPSPTKKKKAIVFLLSLFIYSHVHMLLGHFSPHSYSLSRAGTFTAWKRRRGGGAHKQCIHITRVSKCKNDKIQKSRDWHGN